MRPIPEKKTEYEIKIKTDELKKTEELEEIKQKIVIKDIRKEVMINRDFILEKLKKKTSPELNTTPIEFYPHSKIIADSFKETENIGTKKLVEKIFINDSGEENEEIKNDIFGEDIDIDESEKEIPEKPEKLEEPEKPEEPEKLEEKEKPKKIIKLKIKKPKEPRQPKITEETVIQTTNLTLPKNIETRIPPSEKLILPVSNYYMTNRKLFIDNLIRMFEPYKKKLIDDEKNISCDKQNTTDFQLLTHQRVVRDYLNLYTPYRGLLLYHGLGAGKTNSSIAIAEGMKSQKRIILMTPAALKANFFTELKKYGDPIFRKNQFWEKISTEGQPDYIDILSKVLSLSREYIQKEKGAWLFDIKKPANFKELSKEDQTSIDIQLDKMIRSKYTDINYNGLNRRILDEFTKNSSINPFDHSVVIIDEAHNFVSLIVNQIKKTKSIPVVLYELLMKATDCRIVLLSGTPIINYPNEIGILYNILRGYIKTITFPLTVKTDQKITRDTILTMFSNANFKTYDYVEYSGNQLKITRNPFGFINEETKKKTTYPQIQKGGFFDSLFGGGKKTTRTKTINKSKNRSKIENKNIQRKTRKIPDRLKEPYTVKDGIVKINTMTEKEIGFDINDLEPNEKVNDSLSPDLYEGGGVFEDYDGVHLDDTGNLSDDDFIKRIKQILKTNGLEIQRIHTDNYKALPDNSETF